MRRMRRRTACAEDSRVAHPMQSRLVMPSNKVWDRLVQGRHTALLGDRLPPAPNRPHQLMRVDCRAWSRPLGPLHELRARLEQMNARPPSPESQRLSDDEAAREGHLGELINRAQRSLDVPLVIELGGIAAADDETLRVLSRALNGLGRLLSAVLLQNDDCELGRAEELIAELARVHGEEAVVRVERSSSRLAAPSSAPRHDDELAVDVRRVLRAAAAVGDTFEADLVAGLLMVDPLTALELCQLAIDAGVGLRDHGDGIFSLPPGLGASLRSATTPSLAKAWHAELAASLADPAPQPAAEAVTITPAERTTRPVPAPQPEEGGRVTRSLRELAERWQGRGAFVAPAAAHAEAAGQPEAAIARFLAAALEAAQVGGHERALALCDRASAALPGVTTKGEARRLRLRTLMVRGHIVHLAAGAGPHARLADAVATLEEAHGLLEPSDPAELRVEVAVELAGSCYDLGDLERALALLRHAHGIWMQAGEPLAAARLLNDEAAVLLRMGNLEAAAALLARARDTFLRLAEDGAESRLDLARTDHLVARLPLHAAPDAPLDREALRFATRCGEAAAHAYATLGEERESARVAETLGRLGRLSGQPESARALLTRALEAQQQLGDAIGLARTTAALAQLMAGAGRPGEALAMLNESVLLNLQTGSRQGLEYNRQGLAELQAHFGPHAPPAIANAMRELRERIGASRSAAHA
jgi:tetratricopeptide (TPR) repeat protein